jgi:hypothetical protein
MSKQQNDSLKKYRIKFNVSCSEFNKLFQLHKSGELQELLGIPILELEAFPLKKIAIEQDEQEQEAIKEPLNTVLARQVSHLSQWFKGIIESRWKDIQDPEVEYLSQMFPAFKSDTDHSEGTIIQRCLVINRSMLIQDFIVLLVIKLERIKTEIKANVRLFAAENKNSLPQGIILRLCSQGECKKQVEAREADDCIQLPRFKVQPGDQFTIEVVLADVSFVEEFIA